MISVAIARHVFLHHDRIRPGRNRRAGENPDRFATIETRSFSISASRLLADHAQPLAFLHELATTA